MVWVLCKAKEDADGTLPLLLSWAHGNLLRAAMSDTPTDDEGQFVDSIFKTQMAGCRGTALAPGGGGGEPAALYVAVKDGHAIWKVDPATGRASVLTGGNGIGFRDGMPAEVTPSDEKVATWTVRVFGTARQKMALER